MRAVRFPGLAIGKIFLVLVLTLLAFQSAGINGLAAPAASSLNLQAGEEAQILSCGCSAVTHQVVLLIDDSGSMGTNDPQGQRRKDALALVDTLLAPLQARPNVQAVQVAVIHFSKGITPGSGWKTIPAQLESLREDINSLSVASQGTDFNDPLGAAKDLFSTAAGDCLRRSIVLFTDGTPENDLARRIREPELSEQFTQARSTVQAIPNLEAIYIVGYRVNANYLNEGVKDQWVNLVNWSGLFSSAQNQAPRLVVIPNKDLQAKIEETEKVFEEKVEGFAGLSQYQVAIESVGGDSAAEKGKAIEFTMTLVDGSGDRAQPALPLQLKALTQEGQEILWTEEGDHYKFSLTPELSGMNQFEIAASFSGAQGTGADRKELLQCVGTVGLRTVEIPVTGSSIALSFVVMPPREPVEKDKSIILPLQLISRLNINEVEWSADSPDVRTQAGTPLRARIEPADTDTPGATQREFNLIIDPAGEAETLAVAVAGLAITAQGPIDIPPAHSEIVIPKAGIPEGEVCVYDKAWDRWFWPLAVVLAVLLLLLLAFRWRDAHTQKDYQVVGSDMFWTHKWRFLFLPLVIMLVTLVLNRVWWCYLIPWWLFLAALLGLIVVVFPLAHFIRDERRRAWTLLALFLVGAVLVVFVSITIDRRFLWPLLVALLVWTAIGRWYIRPDERPDPQPLAPAVLSLVSAPACVPFNEPIRLPLHFDYQGGAGLVPSLTWQPSARIMPEGEVAARVMPVDGKNDEYELSIDPVPYQPGAREIRVQVRALAALPDGRSLEIDGPITAIELCPPDHLDELEGIGEKVQDFLYQQGILTFKQLARAEVKTINGWLDAAGWKMMDAKTWPQQAKLAAIVEEFGKEEEDRRTYLAYKAWLKDGIEPDEYEVDEKDRRSDPALVWNGVPQFTPLVLSLALSPSRTNGDQSIRLPVQLNSGEDRVRLASADWKVSARVLPGEAELEATVKPVAAEQGRYELVTAPVGDPNAKEILLSILASVNGRSIEIFYGKAITVQVSPPPAADDLAELEGIEEATVRLLAGIGISNFEQLAQADPRVIKECLDEAGQNMRDAKTWPQQARLADIARKYGREEDQRSYQAYKAWLKGGIEPDEYGKDEKDMRPEALTWYRTAELTETAYAEVFKRQ